MRSGKELQRWLAWELFQQRIRIKRKPRRGPARDWKYRLWIRSLPCAACGCRIMVEAAHTGPHGLSQKASDYSCIPLCSQHHRLGKLAIHKIGPQAFEAEYRLNIKHLTKRLFRCWIHREGGAL